jgi:hypothetical protein
MKATFGTQHGVNDARHAVGWESELELCVEADQMDGDGLHGLRPGRARVLHCVRIHAQLAVWCRARVAEQLRVQFAPERPASGCRRHVSMDRSGYARNDRGAANTSLSYSIIHRNGMPNSA